MIPLYMWARCAMPLYMCSWCCYTCVHMCLMCATAAEVCHVCDATAHVYMCALCMMTLYMCPCVPVVWCWCTCVHVCLVCDCERPTHQQSRCHNRILLHTFIGRALLQRQKDPEPRTGAAYIGLGEACLTPGLVMHLLPHLHVSHPIGYTLSTSQNLIIIAHLHVSHLIGYTLSTSQNLIIMPGPGSVLAKIFPGQAVSWQKSLLHMYTLVVYPNLYVVASGSQRHLVMAYVTSHRGHQECCRQTDGTRKYHPE